MIVVVTGTGTEVGKTWVTAAVARLLRARGIGVLAHKPVQSFDPEDANTDAHVLADATGTTPEAVCPAHRWFPVPMAPPMAAELLDRPPFTVAELAAELPRGDAGLVLVEGAGGVRSPLATDGDTADLARACAPELIVLVADAGLGTINLVRLSVGALTGLRRVVVFLNRFDRAVDLHRRNLEWLRTREGLEIETDPEALALQLETLISR